MKTSENVAELAAAFAQAQGALKGATRDAKNPHFRNDYATLASVIEAGREALAKHGLSVLQGLSSADASLIVTTRLLHSSGQWIEDSLAVPLAKHDAQGMGSAATYGRRYALAAMLGIAQVDDDGNDAAARAPRSVSAYPASQVNHDAFNELPAEAQQVVREMALEVIAYVKDGTVDKALEVVATGCPEQEDKMALWSQLPSDVRSALKRAKA